MFQRINIGKIILDHLKTLKRIDSESNKISLRDIILFFIFPLLIGIALSIKKIGLSGHVSDLITYVSIIGGFLFNLLAIIYGLMDKLQQDASTDRIKEIFVKEVHINISFNIVISLFLLIALLLYSYLGGGYIKCWQNLLYDALTAGIYFLLILFLLTMFMILNRIYILLKKN